MADLEWEANPEGPSLRRAIRQQLPRLAHPCRIVAEAFLAAESRIDLLGVGDAGELVSIRIGSGDDDIGLFTRSMSDIAWLCAHVEDLSKLVPDLGIEPSAEARSLLLCPRFHADTLGAASSQPRGRIELVAYRCFRQHGRLNVVFSDQMDSDAGASPPERIRNDTIQEHAFGARPSEPQGITHAANVSLSPAANAHRQTAPAPDATSAPIGFRTGLRDSDLRPEQATLIEVEA